MLLITFYLSHKYKIEQHYIKLNIINTFQNSLTAILTYHYIVYIIGSIINYLERQPFNTYKILDNKFGCQLFNCYVRDL